MTETKIKRLKRYSIYMIQWIAERMHGLDFTMRDTSLIVKTGGLLHGYSKTDESHAKEIFDYLNVSSSSKLLDVGCGKGAFLREASKYPFGKIAGIEIDKRLVSIAKKNFRILKLDDRIKIFQADALEFEHYGAFNVFYFFNPFDKEIMEQVVDKIAMSQGKSRTYYIILHNPTCVDVIEGKGGMLVGKLYDPMKSYETYIYKCGGSDSK